MNENGSNIQEIVGAILDENENLNEVLLDKPRGMEWIAIALVISFSS